MRLERWVTEARLDPPIRAAHGEVSLRPLVRVVVRDSTGAEGHGEAAPLESYDGVTLDDVERALDDCAAVLAGAASGAPRAELLATCAGVAVLPQAIAAVDLALWDLEGRRREQPVWRLLGAAAARAVPVNATISAFDRAGAAAAAGEARAAGYGTVKVKVGVGDDPGRVAAVRAAAGPDVAIRLDANGAWSAEEAVAALGALAPAGIELCEEPCHGLDAIAAVASGQPVPIAIDESVQLPGALDRRHATAACLKVAACGGITGVLDAARRARAAGYEVYLASTFDGPLGIAAALHAAAAVGPDRTCGLATLSAFADRSDPLPVTGGTLAPPPGPGLGDGLHAWYG